MSIQKYRCDRAGVPVLDREAIESKAEEFIGFFDASTLLKPRLTPLAEICERIRQEFGIQFNFGQDLGVNARGKKILGKYTFEPRTIFVDGSLDFNSPRWLFTLAHELGHFVLHRNLKLRASGAVPSDTEESVSEKGHAPRTSLEWLEWQANKFAASVLLPRRTVRQAVGEFLVDRGTTKIAFGPIYVDHQHCNLETFTDCLDKLGLIYQASRMAIEYRLKELGILVDVRDQSVASIGELLREM